MGEFVVGFFLVILFYTGLSWKSQRDEARDERDELKRQLRAEQADNRYLRSVVAVLRSNRPRPAPSANLDTWRGVLGFPANARPTREEILTAYRTRAQKAHPDRGGSTTEMAAVNLAKTAALKEVAA